MKNEIWKDIKNYEGYYQISNFGRVRSLDRLIIYSNGKRRIHKGILIKTFESAADANREYKNLNYVSISAACHGRIKTYRGYEWRFI